MNNIVPFTLPACPPHPAAMAAAQLLLMNDCLDDLAKALAAFAACESDDDDPDGCAA